MFETYEKEYCEMSQSISRRISALSEMTGGKHKETIPTSKQHFLTPYSIPQPLNCITEKKKAEIRSTQKDMEDADGIVSELSTKTEFGKAKKKGTSVFFPPRIWAGFIPSLRRLRNHNCQLDGVTC
eukprot:TRINITY_DN1922_c0_g4_i1.p1 TRINITY_DN1922_c0_g4~~TRINITY_DN1922_c0_g4_i1.p1  ORF type:complete len:126 (+),score=18.18 TRINITY_DN1922_c0_g4_i1:86-463(+)